MVNDLSLTKANDDELDAVSDEALELAGGMVGEFGPSHMNCPHTLTCE